MAFKQGTYVRHPKDEIFKEWGYGIVVSNEVNKQVSVFFENTLKAKLSVLISSSYKQLVTLV